MTKKTTPEKEQKVLPLEGLALLRKPFAENQISKLPKPTKKQTDTVKADFTKGIRCELCDGWHHKDVIHLDYVGHAALTDRLLDVDPEWNWSPLGTDEKGFPALDKDGGMWIHLTILGITRLGYGDAQGKSGPNATKERIGDALRNGAMRFGCALGLWHKGDLHPDGPEGGDEPQPEDDTSKEFQERTAAEYDVMIKKASGGDDKKFAILWTEFGEDIKKDCGSELAKNLHELWCSLKKEKMAEEKKPAAMLSCPEREGCDILLTFCVTECTKNCSVRDSHLAQGYIDDIDKQERDNLDAWSELKKDVISKEPTATQAIIWDHFNKKFVSDGSKLSIDI